MRKSMNNLTPILGSAMSLGLVSLNNSFAFLPNNYNLFFYFLAFISGKVAFDEIRGRKWRKIFSILGLVDDSNGSTPKLLEEKNNDIGTKYVFNIPSGCCFNDFEKMKPRIETELKSPIMLSKTDNYNVVIQTHNLHFKDKYYFNFEPIENVLEKLEFPIGKQLTEKGEEDVYLNVTEAPHTLIAGETGSGKTNVIRNILITTCLSKLDLYIIDMKGWGDYDAFTDYKYLRGYVKTDIPKAEEMLLRIANEMYSRGKLLASKHKGNFVDYNKVSKEKMYPIIVVIDEFITLSENRNFKHDLTVLLSLCRATNIKIFVATQRPEVKIIDGIIKANLNNTIGMRVAQDADSEIILEKGDYRLTNLPKHQGIIKTCESDIQFKPYLSNPKQIEKLLKSIVNKSYSSECKINNVRTKVLPHDINNKYIKLDNPEEVIKKCDDELI